MAVEKPDPLKESEEKQAPTAEAVLHEDVLAILKNVTPDQVVSATPGAEIIKGTARRSAGWLHGPARLELLAIAVQRLRKTAQQAGMNATRIERVKPVIIKGTKLVVLKAASPEDMTAIPAVRYKGGTSLWVNLIDLLGQEGITVEPNWKELYDITFVPKASPLWPGLLLDLGQKPRDRRRVVTSKKGEGGAEQEAEIE